MKTKKIYTIIMTVVCVTVYSIIIYLCRCPCERKHATRAVERKCVLIFICSLVLGPRCPSVTLCGVQIPSSPSVKHLGLTLDLRVYLGPSCSRENTSVKPSKLKSRTNSNTKLLMYKSLIESVRTYMVSNYTGKC